jgi:predicted glycoside hydrolase/deacetylase ChbG (UPF0249 family)
VEAVQELGISVSHLDSHQHLHLWPLVRDVVLDLATHEGIPAVRVPRSTTAFPGAAVNLLSSELARQARRRGLVFPDAAAGVDDAGTMHGPPLDSALDRLARAGGRAVELSTHPGERNDPARERYRWNYAWGAELEALTSDALRQKIDAFGFVLGTYADLAARGQCEPS